jgi:hypothetical protein
MAAFTPHFEDLSDLKVSAMRTVNCISIFDRMLMVLAGKMPAIAALAYHRASGRQFAQPNTELSYSENFLYMLDAGATRDYKPNPRLARAIDIMFTLHAEHEMNCSTAVSQRPLPPIESAHRNTFHLLRYIGRNAIGLPYGYGLLQCRLARPR